MKYFTLLAMMVLALTTNAQLLDPSFEGGTDASGWAQASTNFGTPLCTEALCGNCGGNCIAYEGDWYAWFGGTGAGVDEEGVVSQVLTIPNGTSASLSFWCVIGASVDSSAMEYVDVYIDGQILWSLRADMLNYYTYTQKTIDISAFTDGQSHTLGLAGYSQGGTSIIFDAFNLTVDGNAQVGINEFINNEQAISFYPNPANEKFNVRFNSSMEGTAQVTVTDITGKVVNTATLSNINFSTFELNTAAYESGFYTITIENNGQLFTNRFAVSH
ncbi:MAG: hypothetical protein RLZZ262_2329 [Bacteroidota bacterium]|jgi:hypothetical protein